ncbi:DAD domain-containing protein [Mycena indigotica]|uniref:DAD domain-containing protein n=1 Tax=Mycena indigotica TaxID=2126181 RepID=A0A8H6TBM9_9AGAR|nr:DAD domain-containing protein [Mycena indigotica]KAF7315800.1 DAD domain-containing protein [Mycena indigotica]
MKVKATKNEHGSHDVAKQDNSYELALWKKEATGGFSCIVPVEEFFSKYMQVPNPPTNKELRITRDSATVSHRKALKQVGKQEKQMYEPFAEYLTKLVSKFDPSRRPLFGATWATVFKTLHKTDHVSKPDIAVSKPDLFDDNGPLNTQESQEALAQLTHNARRIFMAQGSSYVFLLSVFDVNARILRVDHSGYIVSESFKWTAKQSTHMAQFFWRLFMGPSEDGRYLGEDLSTSVPTPRQQLRLLKMLKTLAGYEDDKQAAAVIKSSRCIDVGTGSNKRRCFTIGPPLHQSKGLFSRATRVDRVLIEDEENPRFHVLKEAWTQKCRLPEYVFYKILEHKYPTGALGLTTCIASEDLSRRVGQVHSTITAALREDGHEFQDRYRQRTVMEDVGIPLYEYPDTKTFISAVHDAMQGHQAAVDAGIVHRDVSVGNVLIKQGPNGLEGFILDFDVAMLTEEGWKTLTLLGLSNIISTAALNFIKELKDMTGTYAFVSLAVLTAHQERVSLLHRFEYDIESFYWIILWVLLRHTQHLHVDRALACANFFDHPSDSIALSIKRDWLLSGDAKIFSNNPNLATLVSDLRAPLREALHDPDSLTYNKMFRHFVAARNKHDWPEGDVAMPFTPPNRAEGAATQDYQTVVRIQGGPISSSTWNPHVSRSLVTDDAIDLGKRKRDADDNEEGDEVEAAGGDVGSDLDEMSEDELREMLEKNKRAKEEAKRAEAEAKRAEEEAKRKAAVHEEETERVLQALSRKRARKDGQ